MCPPNAFEVVYRINPWMDPAVAVDRARATRQWQDVANLYLALGHRVEVIDPVAGLPDMVFAANGGLVVGGRAVTARFTHQQRSAESAHYARWFAAHGIPTVDTRARNEGEGDVLLAGERLLAGTGFRTDVEAHREISAVFGLPVTTLHLVDPRYYHLDTALAVLDDTTIAFLPEAFAPASRALLDEAFPDAIHATPQDAACLGLNAVSDGTNVVMAVQAERLAGEFAARGFTVHPVDVSELAKAGGGVKCMTLELRPEATERAAVAS
jgi:N-dimethylarginine dimethylaminohydrolase